MKSFIVVLSLIGASNALFSSEWIGGYRVKFAYGTGIGTDFFFDTPQNKTAAVAAGYTEASRPDSDVLSDLTMYCPSYPSVCVLYDNNGYAAGMQHALSPTYFTNTPFDMNEQGFRNWTYNGETYWAISHYYVDDDFMALDDDAQLAVRQQNPTSFLPLDGVWVTGPGYELVKIVNSTANISSTTWTEQRCLPWMGLHYFNNMSSTTEENVQSLTPFFALYDDKQLVGIGMLAIGNKTLADDETVDCFEDPGETGVKVIVTDGPDWLYQYAGDYGVATSHVYFVDQPQYILCLNN